MYKWIGILFLSLASTVWAGKEPSWQERLAKVVIGEKGGDRLFYYPTRSEPFTPDKYGYRYESVTFPASGGIKLHGWFLPADAGAGKALGTIVYSHGNAGSLANHFGFVFWLMDKGYNVFMYDYRGFGRSEGVVSKAGLVEDVKAAFKYIATRKDIDTGKLISMGHSLGGAKSVAALGDFMPPGLRGIVLVSTFASYVDMASIIAGDAGRAVVTDSYEPVIYAKRLPQVPIMVVHGKLDKTIPISQGKKLYAALNSPKSLLVVDDAQHCNCLSESRPKSRDALLTWMNQALAKKK